MISSEVRLVTRFADDMAERLEANDHKSGWESMSPARCLLRLEQEVGELRRALHNNESSARIRQEAADVGNFAAMVAATYEWKAYEASL